MDSRVDGTVIALDAAWRLAIALLFAVVHVHALITKEDLPLLVLIWPACFYLYSTVFSVYLLRRARWTMAMMSKPIWNPISYRAYR